MNVLQKPTGHAVDEAAYRAAMRRLAAGVTIVTTLADGVDHAMTASAFTAVSLRPPLVLVCVERAARLHEAILASGVWGVSLLSESGQPAAHHLATRGRRLHGQLDGYAVRRGGVTGVALLDDALAQLECRTTATYDAGDHTIVVGEVVAADSTGPVEGPLVHYDGAYHTATKRPSEE